MTVKQMSIFLENRPGQLSGLVHELNNNNIDMENEKYHRFSEIRHDFVVAFYPLYTRLFYISQFESHQKIKIDEEVFWNCVFRLCF